MDKKQLKDIILNQILELKAREREKNIKSRKFLFYLKNLQNKVLRDQIKDLKARYIFLKTILMENEKQNNQERDKGEDKKP